MTIEDLALLFTRGIGSRGASHLVDYFGTAEALFSASRAELMEGAGLRADLAERILRREGMADAEAEQGLNHWWETLLKQRKPQLAKRLAI